MPVGGAIWMAKITATDLRPRKGPRGCSGLSSHYRPLGPIERLTPPCPLVLQELDRTPLDPGLAWLRPEAPSTRQGRRECLAHPAPTGDTVDLEPFPAHQPPDHAKSIADHGCLQDQPLALGGRNSRAAGDRAPAKVPTAAGSILALRQGPLFRIHEPFALYSSFATTNGLGSY